MNLVQSFKIIANYQILKLQNFSLHLVFEGRQTPNFGQRPNLPWNVSTKVWSRGCIAWAKWKLSDIDSEFETDMVRLPDYWRLQ